MNIDFSHYLAIFWRRFHYFALVTVVLTAIGIAVALVLPSEYRSTATLLVESQQIPRDLAPATVQTVELEQLQIIEQRLMTRDNILDTVNRLDVFPDDLDMSTADIVAEMRSRTSFDAQSGRNSATFLRVSFQGESPALVAQVTNDFVTQILQENVRIRTNLAGGTLEFFEDEAERLSLELDAQSADLLKFKSENTNALPENAQVLSERRASRADLISTSRQKINLLERQKQNALKLFEATGLTGQGDLSSPEQQSVAAAQRDLDDALVIFAPTHPRIAILRSRVAQAEARLAGVANQESESNNEAVPTGARAVLDSQIADIDREISDLTLMIEAAEAEMKQIDSWLSEIPANSIILGSLERSYENTQAQYLQATSRLSVAATGERIELLSKGQRIIVLEQATQPTRPFKPNRPVIAGMGIGAGVTLGLGLIVLLEIFNRSIRRPVEITDKLGITPFAVLPYIQTESEARWRRSFMTMMILTFLIGVPLLVWAVHSFAVPLDPYVERFLNKVGLSLTL